MFELLKLRKNHGWQAIPDIKRAEIREGFRGFPILDTGKCQKGCNECRKICPVDAIGKNISYLDMGRCIFCGECVRACSSGAISFSSKAHLGASKREILKIKPGLSPKEYEKIAINSRKEISRIFSHSLKLRQVSAAGCGGCEMELGAATNVNFDMTRFGIDFVASPRHADGIVITGAVSRNMAPALLDAYKSVSEPKIIIAVGSCAISGGLFASSPKLERSFFRKKSIDLFIPGCPPHPLTFINALLKFLDR